MGCCGRVAGPADADRDRWRPRVPLGAADGGRGEDELVGWLVKGQPGSKRGGEPAPDVGPACGADGAATYLNVPEPAVAIGANSSVVQAS